MIYSKILYIKRMYQPVMVHLKYFLKVIYSSFNNNLSNNQAQLFKINKMDRKLLNHLNIARLRVFQTSIVLETVHFHLQTLFPLVSLKEQLRKILVKFI